MHKQNKSRTIVTMFDSHHQSFGLGEPFNCYITVHAADDSAAINWGPFTTNTEEDGCITSWSKKCVVDLRRN